LIIGSELPEIETIKRFCSWLLFQLNRFNERPVIQAGLQEYRRAIHEDIGFL
jgi:hypothetical protein